jgi:hypothetical protein
MALFPAPHEKDVDFKLSTDVRRGEFKKQRFFVSLGRKTATRPQSLKPFHFTGEVLASCSLSLMVSMAEFLPIQRISMLQNPKAIDPKE